MTPQRDNSRPGVYVAMEGLDGSGGTTQLARLGDRWRSVEPEREQIRTREPSDGPIGRLIRAQLAGGEVGDAVLPYLFAADRRDHLDRVILPALTRGAAVLGDRYAMSSFAYQSEALGIERVMGLNQDFPAPHLTVMLDLAPEACLDRIVARGGTRERFETLDRLRRIEAAYEVALARCAALGWRIVRFNADQPVDTLAGQVWAAVAALLPGVG